MYKEYLDYFNFEVEGILLIRLDNIVGIYFTVKFEFLYQNGSAVRRFSSAQPRSAQNIEKSMLAVC